MRTVLYIWRLWRLETAHRLSSGEPQGFYFYCFCFSFLLTHLFLCLVLYLDHYLPYSIPVSFQFPRIYSKWHHHITALLVETRLLLCQHLKNRLTMVRSKSQGMLSCLLISSEYYIMTKISRFNWFRCTCGVQDWTRMWFPFFQKTGHPAGLHTRTFIFFTQWDIYLKQLQSIKIFHESGINIKGPTGALLSVCSVIYWLY